jgi:protein-S-isoprenylcysteine O-methyltransferase Ste14
VIDQFSLFGLKQGIAAWKGKPMPDPRVREDGPFAYIRHPLTSFLILAVWSHHVLSASRLEWNILVTLYSLIGVIFEERDMMKSSSAAEYADYRSRIPAFIPWRRARR